MGFPLREIYDRSSQVRLRLCRAIKLAANDTEYVFPGCQQVGSRLDLPVRGNGLRHSYKNQLLEAGVEELLQEILMGHAPSGLSRKYVARFVAASGRTLREAQQRVSARVIELLGLKLGVDF
jgi:hypothetical protein